MDAEVSTTCAIVIPEAEDEARRFCESLLAEMEAELTEMEGMVPDWVLTEQEKADLARREAHDAEMWRQAQREHCVAESSQESESRLKRGAGEWGDLAWGKWTWAALR